MAPRLKPRSDGGVIIEPPKTPTPGTTRTTPTTPRTPTVTPPRRGTQTSYNTEMVQDSGAGGTYGRPVISKTTIKTYDNKTGKLIGSKSTQQNQVYKAGRYVKENK